MLQRVAGAIHAGTFAVPQPEYAIDLAVRVGFHLLRAEHGRRGEILVHGRQELDVVLVEERFRPPEFLVEAAQRRSPVPANEPGGIEARGAIDRPLHERNAHQRLGARHEDAARLAPVAVEQLVVVERERRSNQVCSSRHWGDHVR